MPKKINTQQKMGALGNDELFKKIGNGPLVVELKRRFDNLAAKKNWLLEEQERLLKTIEKDSNGFGF